MQPDSPAPLLRVTEEEGLTAARFAPNTRLTEENAADLGRALALLVAGRPSPRVALDLGAVEFLSSVALAALVVLHKRVRGAGGHLSLVNPQPHVRRVLQVCRLDRVLDIRAA
jgi:anti-anti-sigma factor